MGELCFPLSAIWTDALFSEIDLRTNWNGGVLLLSPLPASIFYLIVDFYGVCVFPLCVCVYTCPGSDCTNP